MRPSEAADAFEVVTEPRALQALEAEWDALWDRVGNEYVSARFTWCWAAWQKVSQPLGRRLHCVVARSGGRLVLVWPFVVYRDGLWKRARPLGPETAEYSSVLVENDALADARVAQAWRLLSRTCRCDFILLPHVPSGSRLHRLVAGERRPRSMEPTTISSTRIETEEDRIFVERILRSKSLAQRRRRLAQRGEVRFDVVEGPERGRELVRWMLQHKTAWAARTKAKKTWKRDDLYRDFLWAALSDRHLRVFAITLDGIPVAACLARVDRLRIETFLSAYDAAFAEFSPGQNLRLECLRYATAHGLEYDLRVGDQPYKGDWTNRHGAAVSYNLSNSCWGALALAMREAQYGLKARLRSSEAAYGS